MALHSNYQVRWKNFKGFKDTGWITIKPITILLGSNNSGKTNFIAPLLLMSQTISSKDSSSPLIVKGGLYDGGNIKELINNYDLNKDIFFGFRYHIHDQKKRLKKIGSYAPGAIEITLGINNDQDRDIVVKNETIYDMYLREFLKFKLTRLGNYSLEGLDTSKMSVEEKSAIEKSIPLNFLFSPNSLLSVVIKETEKDDEKASSKRFSQEFSELLKAISFNFSVVKEILSELSFIGPIRKNPERFYEITNENYNTVGQSGENMPSLLKKNYKEFEESLNEWVKKFGFGDKLKIDNLGKGNLYSILFTENNSEFYTNIANAGFGASQLLPLIVQALVSPKGSLTITEQPEIHLNPRLQCVLAELFAYMAQKEQRIIIETHSEHLLLRLRLLVATQKLSSDDIAIYFVEKRNGESKIREIKIETDGHINPAEWPDGFFEETLIDSLALATEQIKNAI